MSELIESDKADFKRVVCTYGEHGHNLNDGDVFHEKLRHVRGETTHHRIHDTKQEAQAALGGKEVGILRDN
ncbi:hypothetical protein N7478_007339 [Penicillium angulare]|uniref:uncharacterized protein n=1 Tax=Penicillium angulare TaxID=116970 RepID=UPI0025412A77|nr:uncharacterized protein N7478_007339 [Penicillium angulare]KAJ5281967.1 hypothetical protein N7478_007339 [Penicillium angulare]